MLLHHFCVLGLTLQPSDAYLSLCVLVFRNFWNLLVDAFASLLHPRSYTTIERGMSLTLWTDSRVLSNAQA